MADEDNEFERPRKIPKTLKEKDSGKRLIVILEKASLETVKVLQSLFYLQSLFKHETSQDISEPIKMARFKNVRVSFISLLINSYIPKISMQRNC